MLQWSDTVLHYKIVPFFVSSCSGRRKIEGLVLWFHIAWAHNNSLQHKKYITADGNNCLVSHTSITGVFNFIYIHAVYEHNNFSERTDRSCVRSSRSFEYENCRTLRSVDEIHHSKQCIGLMPRIKIKTLINNDPRVNYNNYTKLHLPTPVYHQWSAVFCSLQQITLAAATAHPEKEFSKQNLPTWSSIAHTMQSGAARKRSSAALLRRMTIMIKVWILQLIGGSGRGGGGLVPPSWPRAHTYVLNRHY